MVKQMMKPIGLVLMFLVLSTSLAFAETTDAAASVEKPSVFMSKIVNAVVDRLKQDDSIQHDAKSAQDYIVTLLDQYVDVSFMAQYIAGPSLMKSASSSDQTAFDQALTRWVANLYYGAFKLYDPSKTKISIYPVRGDYQTAKTVMVHSVVKQSNASQISVDYRCRRDGNTWKVYDLCVDNICVLQNLRSQVGQISKDLGSKASLPQITDKISASVDTSA